MRFKVFSGETAQRPRPSFFAYSVVRLEPLESGQNSPSANQYAFTYTCSPVQVDYLQLYSRACAIAGGGFSNRRA
jgi:hypothetical protein